jgi:hypothetical protein
MRVILRCGISFQCARFKIKTARVQYLGNTKLKFENEQLILEFNREKIYDFVVLNFCNNYH